MTTQLTVIEMLPATRLVSVGFETSITPPTATLKRSNIHSITPSRPKKAASVTMNAGSRSRVMSVPRTSPITVQVPTPIKMHSHQGKLYGGATSAAMRPAPMPAL